MRKTGGTRLEPRIFPATREVERRGYWGETIPSFFRTQTPEVTKEKTRLDKNLILWNVGILRSSLVEDYENDERSEEVRFYTSGRWGVRSTGLCFTS